jgi:hypothetical protein
MALGGPVRLPVYSRLRAGQPPAEHDGVHPREQRLGDPARWAGAGAASRATEPCTAARAVVLALIRTYGCGERRLPG